MGHETKDDYLSRISAKLDDIERKVGGLQEQFHQRRTEFRREKAHHLQRMKAKFNEVEMQLLALTEDSMEVWRNHRPAVEQALDELVEAVDRAAADIEAASG